MKTSLRTDAVPVTQSVVKTVEPPARGPQVQAKTAYQTNTTVPTESQSYPYNQQMGYQPYPSPTTMEEMAMHLSMQAAAMEQAYQWQLALAHQVGSITDTHDHKTPHPAPSQRIYQLEALLQTQAGHSLCAMCGESAGFEGWGMEGSH